MNKDESLNKSKRFCMLPWTHLQVRPDGNAYNCCMASEDTGILGNANTSTLKEIWNSDKMKETRLKMMNDEDVEQCLHCNRYEGNAGGSFRTGYNDKYGHLYDYVLKTKPDGGLDEMNLHYIDFRLSNICNFRCRSCGLHASSNWYDDTKALYGTVKQDKIVRVVDKNPDFLDQMDEILPTLEEIYFAGGEPLIMDEHYKILQCLIDNNKTDVHIWYNTNLSQMSYKGIDVMKLWQQFPNVKVSASLDASHARGEYLRKGQNWAQTEANRIRMLKVCPHVRFTISATVGGQNIWHLPDFYDEWVSKGWLKRDAINFNFMYGPDWQTAFMLPNDFKEQVLEKYQNYAEANLTRVNNPWFYDHFINAAKIPFTQDDTHLIPKFQLMTHKLDAIRGEKFVDVFPELKFLYGAR